MPRAETEAQVLQAMDHHFAPHGAMVYPGKDAWNAAKVRAFKAVKPWSTVLELGVGELGAWRLEPELLPRAGNYQGVEGSRLIFEKACEDFPDCGFNLCTLGFWLTEHQYLQPWAFDLAVCCDVLYHLPTDELHDAVLRRLFTAQRALVFTYATDPREYVPKDGRPGASGWDYFPRPRAAMDAIEKAERAGGWRLVHVEDMDSRGHLCPQRVVGMVRV